MHSLDKQILRKRRVRAKISGTSKRPRLSVKITNKNVICQLVDDETNRTMIYVSTINNKDLKSVTMTEKAKWAGVNLAQKAKKTKINQVVFDRSSKIYHGRIKVIADSAREGGLTF